ncbi:hypothetical protein [Clostridium sp. BJN0013]|uniref:hypothetical protein n=1 Tax=Clostridium sp. BJN0013 TaxID=3236840 RepID=UPI0034C6D490
MKDNVTKVDFSKNKKNEKMTLFLSLKKFFINLFSSKNKTHKEDNKIIPYSRYIS